MFMQTSFAVRLRRPPHILSLFLLTAGLARGEIAFTGMTPSRGPVGTVVTLTTTGLVPNQPHTVKVNGTTASISQVTATTVTFTVAPGTTSGNVVLTEAGVAYTNAIPFQVLRPIQGTFNPPLGVNRQGYEIAAANLISPANPGTGQFSTAVPMDRRMVVWAFRGETDPVFLAVVPASANSVVIDATSTARAWTFVSPFVATRDEARGQAALDRIATLPEVTTLANQITSSSVGGLDYAEDAQFSTKLLAAIQAYLTAPAGGFVAPSPQDFEPGTPRGTYLRYLNPDPDQKPVPQRRLKVGITDTDANQPYDYRFKFESADNGNRLDWFVEVYELDPDQFSFGRQSVLTVNEYETLDRTYLDPVGTAVVNAELLTKPLDIVDLAAGWVTKQLFTSYEEAEAINQVRVLKDQPAVYVTQAYSGNPWYGTAFFFPQNVSQSDLLDRLHANPQWGTALAANIFISVVDMASAFVEVDAFVEDPKLKAKIMHSIITDVSKAISIRTPGGLDESGVMDVVKTSASAALKALIAAGAEGLGEIAEEGALQSLRKWTGRVGRFFAKTFDIAGKVSSGLQSLERASGYTSPYALAMERSIIVVGNPFEPVILSFHAQRGRAGDTVVVQGYNFPDTIGEVQVSFCSFASTANPDVPTAKLPVVVQSITPTSLAFTVPANFASVFPNLQAHIGIEIVGSDVLTSTIPLPAPYHLYYFVPPPQLFSVSPNPVAPGGVLTLTGTNFFLGAAEDHRVLFDGGTQVSASVASETSLMVTVPVSLAEGPHTVAVRLRDQTTVAMPFVVQRPASDAAGFQNGLGITVTRLDNSTGADGQISLREAVLIANGALGRPIEQHAACESIPQGEPGHCAPQVRETDWVNGDDGSGNGGGPLSRDTIVLGTGLTPPNNVFNGTLPGPTSGDTYNMNVIIDGGGAAGPGWLLDNVEGVALSGATFRNFSGHGVHLRNGARGNRLSNVRVESVGGSGVFFDGNAQHNYTLSLRVSGAGQHGAHLSGAQVRNNLLELPGTTTTSILGLLENCGGNGVRIEGGAQFNQVQPGTVRSNAVAGIVITGASTMHNLIGRPEGSLPRYYDIYRNGGPGIHLDGVQHNVVRYANPAGNQGDGILLEGVNCAFNQVDGVYTGVDYFTGAFPPPALPNQGSGIHLRNGAHHNLIGSRIPGSFGGRGFICGDRDDGVLIEGADTAHNTVSRKHIGETPNGTYAPNGGSGIHIRNGAHHNLLGDTHQFLDLHVMASLNAGILIEGAGTDFNEVIGSQFSTSHGGLQTGPGVNRIGIHIKDFAKGNVIGLPGQAFAANGPTGFNEYRFGNSIVNSIDAGVVLDNCGGTLGPNGELLHPNVVQNNKLGEGDGGTYAPSAFGVKLINDAQGNVIGGTRPGQGNRIVYNRSAGILISNVVLVGASPPNRIQNNVIFQNGNFNGVVIGGPGNPTRSPDPLDPAITGVGVAVVNSVGGAVGEQLVGGNQIVQNLIGVYLANSQQARVWGNTITNNRLAGVVIRGGGLNEIGGRERRLGNRIYGNGQNAANQGGVIIGQSDDNRVLANIIGVNGAGNRGPGVLLSSAAGNRIGGESPVTGNAIGANQSHGVLVTGAASDGNTFRNNFIGTNDKGAVLPNTGAGIRLEQGASDNVMGGDALVPVGAARLLMPMPNLIANNTGDGVEVNGATTVGNRIQYNRITANGGKGIRHVAAGNHNIPPPLQTKLDGAVLRGIVPDLVAVPPGSVINVYADADFVEPEGDQHLGEGIVQADGRWSAVLVNVPPLPITMTSTHAVDGSTSEFGIGSIDGFSAGFFVQRTDNRATDTAPAGAVRLPVLRITASAETADVRVNSLTFDASGTLDDTAAVTSVELYRDVDGNGVITAADPLLAGPATFAADNGQIVFDELDVTVPGDSSQRWLLTYTLSLTPPAGATFGARLNAASSVEARFVISAGAPVPAKGIYPVQSAEYTVNAQTAQTFTSWKATKFNAGQLANPAVSGITADPDGDGVTVLLEYAFNLEPLLADADANTLLGAGLPVGGVVTVFVPETQQNQDFFTVTYVRRKQPSDIAYWLEVSNDLVTWIGEGQAPGMFEVVSQTDVGNGLVFETVVLRSMTPMTEPNAGDSQYFRVRVQLLQ